MTCDDSDGVASSDGSARAGSREDVAPGSRDPDALLARAGTSGDPDRDQHFLIDDRVLDRVPRYATEAGIDTGHVLEIGAGTGALTDRLLAVGDVTTIERDPELSNFLREEFADAIAAGRLDVIEGDALDVEFPAFTAAIANLPYGASSEFLFALLERRRPLVVMVQREFAERLVADPDTGEYGRLSVTAGHYAETEIVETVPPEAFAPPPAVESAVVRALPREPEYARDEQASFDDDLFFDLVTAVFTQRRKTMRNAIRNTAHISGLDDPEAVVAAADETTMSARAGKLDPATFADLARLAGEHGVER